VTDLVHTLLTRRALLPACALLDCLDLADWLGLRIRAGLIPHVTTAELQTRWNCTQSTVSRRVSALMEHGLIEATLQAGPGAYWAVKRVGPVA
jgi:DNA-binding MarR family transcriptional regulator